MDKVPGWEMQHSLQAFDTWFFWARFLHKFLTYPPSILLLLVFNLPQLDSNPANFLPTTFVVEWGFYCGGDGGGIFWIGCWSGELLSLFCVWGLAWGGLLKIYANCWKLLTLGGWLIGALWLVGFSKLVIDVIIGFCTWGGGGMTFCFWGGSIFFYGGGGGNFSGS